MSDAKRQPPRIDARPWLVPQPAATRFSFRGGADAAAIASRAFGVELPSTACRANPGGERAALWLGPDEQLLLAPEHEAAALRTTLSAALSGVAHSLVDISHRQTAFLMTGPQAEWLLNTGCPLDLDAKAFPVGMCTRTVYMKSEILLWRLSADTFRVEVWRSFADYVVKHLEEAALEFAA